MLNEKSIRNIGLSQKEAEEKLKRYGPNVLDGGKSISPLKIFFAQFNDFMTFVLIGATLVSGIMGEKADAITILIIIVMNAILGFYQEYNTEKSLEALKKLAAPTAKVKRDNIVSIVSAANIVPGDIVVFESGDRISADAVLISASNLIIDESLLTGESVGVTKDLKGKKNDVFMGTIVLAGKGEAFVTNTGMNTEMGKIANMLSNIDEDISPLKEKLASMGKILVLICLVICVAVTALGIFRGQGVYQMFLLGVSLAVAAIPEGLPAIVTVALALGVKRMLKRKALVRKLPAVETLGCTSVICSDKTGTLTQNIMTVKTVYSGGNLHNLSQKEICDNKILKDIFTYCNDCSFDFNEKNPGKAIMGDPTEVALIKAFYNDSREIQKHLLKSTRLQDNPFDSDRKMMSVIVRNDNKKISYVKGAPERIVKKCKYILDRGTVVPITSAHINRIEDAVEKMSSNALRCIAGAYAPINVISKHGAEENLIFVGIAGMIDPPRLEVKDAVLNCRIAGITPVMITGDHKNTAFAIAKELDICKNSDEVITGEELDELNSRELDKVIKKARVFARVSPNHKLKIVQGFKRQNKIVAMTGDGVNDAPAVKEADIGISMGISGTDVTKEASSMILLDDNFSTIVAAVEEGRVIYSNIRKFIRYLLACNLGEVLTMFLASLLYLDTPLLPIQILFVNLATDGLPAIALGMEPPNKEVMKQRPREKDESIFARGLKEKIFVRGALIGICTVLAFLVARYYGATLKTSRTIALSTLILSQLLHVFECKSEEKSLFQINIFTNMYLVAAVSISVIMLISIIYVPFLSIIFHTTALTLKNWLIVIFFSLIISVINSTFNLVNSK
ncbi:MAG: calcium-translocating P-type ATPase, PMCA-type [Clostridiaceae bacterium]